MSSNLKIIKICEYCGKEFVAKKTTTRTCSDRCSKLLYKKRKREEKLKQIPSVEVQKVQFRIADIKDKEFLSIAEACVLLGVSRMTIYRLGKSGKIKITKIGRRSIIKRSEIDKLFE